MNIPTEQSVRTINDIPKQWVFLGFVIHSYITDEFLAEYSEMGRCWSRIPDISLRFEDVIRAANVCKELELDPDSVQVVAAFDSSKHIHIQSLSTT